MSHSTLTIATSAVGRAPVKIADLTDRDCLFGIIDRVVGCWACAHALEQTAGGRGFVLTFTMREKALDLAVLTHVVAEQGRRVTGITASWSGVAPPTVRVSVLSAATLAFGDAVSYTPKFEQRGFRATDIETTLAAVDARDRPEDWSRAVEVLHDVAHIVRNKSRFLPNLRASLQVHPTRRSYSLVFEGMDSLEYPVLEAISQVCTLDAVLADRAGNRLTLRLKTARARPWTSLGARATLSVKHKRAAPPPASTVSYDAPKRVRLSDP